MEDSLLEQLPSVIKNAFNHGFVFIVTDNLVQHFPARQWTDQQILENLFERYQAKGSFKVLKKYRIIELEGRSDLVIVVP